MPRAKKIEETPEMLEVSEALENEFENAGLETPAGNEDTIVPLIENTPPPPDTNKDAQEQDADAGPGNRMPDFYSINFRADRSLPEEEQQAWNEVYASYRSRSILSGTVSGVDETQVVINGERKSVLCLVVIKNRIKIIIPEAEMWHPNDQPRPPYVVRNMMGADVDFVILQVDKDAECAVASRRMALETQRYIFERRQYKTGDILDCQVMSVGPGRCLVSLYGYDITLSPKDMAYQAIPDLRAEYHPGMMLRCRLMNVSTDEIQVSVKETRTNPFIGADKRHPAGSSRHGVISGKYGGGIYCTLDDGTVCLCRYSAQHRDADFIIGDRVVLRISQYNYDKQQIYGRITAKW